MQVSGGGNEMKKGFSIFLVIGITIITLPIILSYHPNYYESQRAGYVLLDEESEPIVDKFIRRYMGTVPEVMPREEYDNVVYILDCLGEVNLDTLNELLDSADTREVIDTFLEIHLYDYQLSWLKE